MKNLYTIRDRCRLCCSSDLVLALELGPSPISEKYASNQIIAKKQQQVPLDLFMCVPCGHVQLIYIVHQEHIWNNYSFKTNNKTILVHHMAEITKHILSVIDIGKEEYVVDIGSNDGTLLQSFKDHGCKNIVGIEPVKEIADEATSHGIHTINRFMNCETANQYLRDKRPAKLVTAFNVYAHADDLIGMTKAVSKILAPEGLFVFEVSYLLDVVKKMLIGTIFHEHLSYHSVSSIDSFLRSAGLQLINVESAEEQGGSMIGYVQHKDGPLRIQDSVNKFIKRENREGLLCIETFNDMHRKLISLKKVVKEQIKKITKAGKTIAGYGASRSSTTLLSFFELFSVIKFIFDDNDVKHFKYSPGAGIPIFPVKFISEKAPDYLIIFAWMHTDTILKKNIKFLKEGGKFIEIHPQYKIIDINNVEY